MSIAGTVGFVQLIVCAFCDRFLDQEGYFATGDLATVSSDGLFSITGRKKDTFKVRGWQVSDRE